MSRVDSIGKKRIKVAVGLSGGVDSSVALFLLKERGHDVTAVHLKCWNYDEPGCRGSEDRADAVKVASQLGVPIVRLDFEKEYRKKVIGYFFDEIKTGRTPNPDIVCNREIKFGLFLDWAVSKGFDYVATGHYARIKKESDGSFNLLSGIDESKDQSYFLYLLTKEQLARSMFPLGELTKKEVRAIARKMGFVTADKPDSVGICFIGDIEAGEFIKRNVKVTPGTVLDIEGNTIGWHEGVELYTIGQRRGLKLNQYSPVPMYVVSKEVKSNTVTVGLSKDVEKKDFHVGGVHWINTSSLPLENKSSSCLTRIRNLGEKLPGSISSTSGNILLNSQNVKVELSDCAIGVAPGQSAVFYDSDVVLGGGVIS
ncbi:tRNA 2-thiouridine(34) synthase MnmA [candidate division WWE3 bacterium]|nr:tRNA 2-thiouridine(34) synthase MnmA [candidate division WWE3 bacterium]